MKTTHKRTRTIVLLALTQAMLLAAAVTALAQPPAGRRAADTGNGGQPSVDQRVEMMSRALHLSADQKAGVSSIMNAAESQAASVRAQLETLHSELADAVKGNAADQIDKIAGQLGVAQGQDIAIHAKADAKIYALLNADQQAKFLQMPRPGANGPRPAGRSGPPPNSDL
jgi:Spy/CpxP family protein refolding chaperone